MKRYFWLLFIAFIVGCGSSGHRRLYPPAPDSFTDSDVNNDSFEKEVANSDTSLDEATSGIDTNLDIAVDEGTGGPIVCHTDNDCKNAPLDTEKCQKKVCNTKTHKCDVAWDQGCCMDKVLFEEDFNNGMPKGWVIKDNNKSDNVSWNVVKYRSADNGGALYIGDPDCHTYYTGPMKDCKPEDGKGDAGNTVRVSIQTPAIQLPDIDGYFVMTFYVWSETEPLIPKLQNVNQPDQMFITIQYGENFSKSKTLFSTVDIEKNTNYRFKFVALNLRAYKGEKVRFVFTFDTLGAKNNYFEGVYIDNLKIFTTCNLNICHSGDQPKSDGDDCTDDNCIIFINSAGVGYYAHPKDPDCGKECLPETVKHDCPVDDPCKKAECVDFKCKYTTITPCCIKKQIFHDDFENGNLKDYVQEYGATNNSIRWQVVTKRAAKGIQSLYYGNNLRWNYDSGNYPNWGYIMTQPFTVPEDTNTFLSFDLFLSTQWDKGYTKHSNEDRFWVEAVQKEGEPPNVKLIPTVLWDSSQIQGTTKGKFIPVGIDLTQFAGKDIAIRFNFDTGDGKENTAEGVYLDNIDISTDSCNRFDCEGDYDCRIDGTCRTGSCKDKKCDVSKAFDGCCSYDLDCDDKDQCTIDMCGDDNKCQHQFVEGPVCCKPSEIANYNFDDGKLPQGFELNNTCEPITDQDPKCSGWQVSDKKSNSGVYALYFGNGTDYSSASGASKGSFDTPVFRVPMWGDTQLSFNILLLLNPKDQEDPTVEQFTVQAIQVSDGGNEIKAYTLAKRGAGIPLYSKDPNKFDHIDGISITQVAKELKGKLVKIRFIFDTVDDGNNTNGLGVFIDDIKIEKVCPNQSKK